MIENVSYRLRSTNLPANRRSTTPLFRSHTHARLLISLFVSLVLRVQADAPIEEKTVSDFSPDTVVHGYVKHTDSKGCFVYLTRDIVARVLIKDVSHTQRHSMASGVCGRSGADDDVFQTIRAWICVADSTQNAITIADANPRTNHRCTSS